MEKKMEYSFSTIILPPISEPKSNNIAQEKINFKLILDKLSEGENYSNILNELNEIFTEWLTWQLGILTGFLSDNEVEDETILSYGILSIMAADRGEWKELQGSNRITLAGWLVKHGYLNEALLLCNKAIYVTGPIFTGVYAAAHSVMANIETIREDFLKASYHWDCVFRILKRNGSTEILAAFAKNALYVYYKLNDLAGIINITALTKGVEEAIIMWEKSSYEYLAKLSQEGRINMFTRFLAYGFNDAALIIKKFIQNEKSNNRQF